MASRPFNLAIFCLGPITPLAHPTMGARWKKDISY